MFTSLKRDQLSSYSKYKVEVKATTIETSSLLNPSNRFIAGIKKGSKATVAGLTVFMMLLVMFVGMLTTAPKANASMVDDIKQDMLCRQGADGFAPQKKLDFISATTGDGFSSQPTAFEKYGYAGNNFASWLGFSTADPSTFGFGERNSVTTNDGMGIESSTGIITSAGKDAFDSGLDDWINELKGSESSGLWNHDRTCSYIKGAYIGNFFSDVMLNIGEFSMGISNQFYTLAAGGEGSIMDRAEPIIDKIVITFRDKLYFMYLLPVIMIGSLYMAYVGLVKRRTTQFFANVIWSVAVIVGGVALMSSPSAMPKMVTSITGSISASILASASSSADGNDLCVVPKTKATDNPKKMAKNATRQLQCNMWYTYSYTPWVNGQFGKSPEELVKDGAIRKLAGNNIVYSDDKMTLKTLKVNGSSPNIQLVKLGNRVPESQSVALSMLDYKSNWDDADAWQKYNKSRGAMNIAAVELGSKKYNEDFKGENTPNRIAVSFVAMTGALLTSLFIIVISCSIIFSELFIIILTLVLPFFALLAIIGDWGRRLATKWAWTIAQAAIRRILLTVYLAGFIAIIQSFATDTTGGWFMSSIIMVIVAIAGLVFMKPVLGMVEGKVNAESFMQVPGNVAKRGVSLAIGSLSGPATALGAEGIGNKMTAKSTALKIASKSAVGAGRSPQRQTESWSKDSKTSHAGNRTNKKPQKGSDETLVGEENSSGAGQTPQFEQNQGYESKSFTDTSGVGEAPQHESPAELEQEAPVAPLTRKEQRMETKATSKRIAKELKDNGYRSRVGLGTVLSASIKGAYVGATTGSVRSAISASTSTVNRKKQAIQQANAEAVKNVSQKHRDRNYEIARQQRQSEFEKAQAKRKAEREANMKRNADERAKRYAGSSNQQGKAQQPNSAGQSPQSKPATQPAQKVTYQQTEHAPQVSNPATPYVEVPRNNAPAPQVSNPVSYVNETQAPRVETPRYNPPAPQPVSKPANYTSEVQAPRVEQPRQPAPQPVREQPRNEAPRVEAPRQPAPRVEQPRNEAPRVETPRYNPPAPKPVREQPKQSVVPPKAQTPKPVIQPRKSAPAPKPVVKENKPKVSNPKPPVSPAKPPAPPVKAPAPKAKVNPPKVEQAPQPPTPTRRSIRESGNQTPPAPKPPQPRNR